MNTLPKQQAKRTQLVLAALLLASVRALSASSAEAEAKQKTCARDIIEEITSATNSPVPTELVLNCSVTLPTNAVVTKNIVFEGAEASGSILDCQGSTIDATAGKGTLKRIAVEVRSQQMGDERWSAPTNIIIRNCTIKGFVRIRGLDYTGSGKNVKASSEKRTHTAFIQASAPSHIELLNLKIQTPDNIALYVGPGVTATSLINSDITGHSRATAVYLDAESADNVIENNSFNVTTKSRELIAIDGSARNLISGNIFRNPKNGGIFIYRNCGEGGTIRHQKPEGNRILENVFQYEVAPSRPAVWLGSRGGKQSYCFSDPRYPFGSSLSPNDFAMGNLVENNSFTQPLDELIQDQGQANIIRDNRQTGNRF
jgi:parallel beta-helix repeat protein